MNSLFTDSMVQSKKYNFPRMNNIRRGSMEQIGRLTEYITDRQLYLPNSHLVIRLLKSLNVSMNTDVYDYVNKVRDNIRTITHTLDFTSPTNYGKVHKPGTFINPNIGEIIISNTETFDVDFAVKNWRKLSPLKFLDHPCSDISYGLPDGKYTLDHEEGIVVISINVPMLALQYRCWLSEQLKIQKEQIPALASFVMTYPIMNMAKSHADIALFNRLYNDVVQYKNTGFTRRNPIALIDYTNNIDLVVNEYKTILLRTPLDFQVIIDNIPTIYYDNFHNAIRLPKLAPTRQIRWAIIASRLKIFHFLCEIDSNHKHYANRDSLNEMREIIADMENDKEFAKILGTVEIERINRIKDLVY